MKSELYLQMQLQSNLQKSLDDLNNMLRREESIKRQHKRFGSTRHNRFGTMISVVKNNDLRLTVPGQSALNKSPFHTLEKLDSAKKYVKPVRHSEAVPPLFRQCLILRMISIDPSN